MFPLNQATAPKLPSLTCQTRTPSQSPSVGGWANVHGHGTAHLQTSNQSPTRCQLGTSAIPSPPLAINHSAGAIVSHAPAGASGGPVDPCRPDVTLATAQSAGIDR